MKTVFVEKSSGEVVEVRAASYEIAEGHLTLRTEINGKGTVNAVFAAGEWTNFVSGGAVVKHA